jgi:ribose/xylose/arabinose/galactoside ABC-type transport system permease subunit
VGSQRQKNSVTPSRPADLPASKATVGRWLNSLFSEYFGLGLTFVLLAALTPFTPGLLTTSNFLNVLTYLLPLLIAAIGMTLVMITGGIDLSATSVIALSSVVGATVMTSGHQTAAVGILAMLLVGATVGAANGAIITFLRLPPFIVTLASMTFFSGLAVWFTQSKGIDHLPGPFLKIGQRLPIAGCVTIAVALTAAFFLQKTIYGRWLYAIGQNPISAHISGVPVRAGTFAVYVLSGICAALSSVILTGRLETASPVLGREMLLDVIGATVIGGVSLFGGKGRVSWAFYGVLFLVALDNALNLLNLSQFAITMAKGGAILFAATLDALRQRWSAQTP